MPSPNEAGPSGTSSSEAFGGNGYSGPSATHRGGTHVSSRSYSSSHVATHMRMPSHAGPSTLGSSGGYSPVHGVNGERGSPPRGAPMPYVPATHVQAIHDFDPLSVPSAAADPSMYLCFKAGEIIRVYTRDERGWWDGEVTASADGGSAPSSPRKGPRRGWFPSNYVKELGWDGAVHQRTTSLATTASTSISSPVGPSRPVHIRQRSTASFVSGRAGPSYGKSGHRSRPSQALSITSVQSTEPALPAAYQPLLVPILQALTVLEASIHDRKMTHIQPATAMVISAIRAGLEGADCLSKDSQTLAAHPSLGKERKVVLVELSRLVACARLSSSVQERGERQPTSSVIGREEEELAELEKLAAAGRAVFAAMQMFLGELHECGVQPNVAVASSGTAGESATTAAATAAGAAGSGEALVRPPSDPASAAGRSSITSSQNSQRSAGIGIGHRPRSPPPGNTRMQEAFKMRAASIGDLRAARMRSSSPPPPMPNSAMSVSASSQSSQTSQPAARNTGPSARTPNSAATFQSSVSGDSGTSSPLSAYSSRRHSKLHLSTDSSAESNTTPASPASSTDGQGSTLPNAWQYSPTLLQTPVNEHGHGLFGSSSSFADLSNAVDRAEERVLSIIAALVGHIHSHHHGSHPSSHALLIERTRQTIDAIRELLSVVEAVGANDDLRQSRGREIDSLKAVRDDLYTSASSLVEAAEVVANAPFAVAAQSGPDTPAEVHEADKGRLLQATTNTLRVSSTCLRIVRSCVPESQEMLTATPRPDAAKEQTTPRPPALNAGFATLRPHPVGQRGAHTLSSLHRKMNSLGQLQTRITDAASSSASLSEDDYASGASFDGHGRRASHPSTETDEDNEDEEELAADSAREGDEEEHTMRIAPFGPGQTRSSHDGLSTPVITRTTAQGSPGRSRASSLASPAPPRFGHRSPSRSADLDKFTSDYDIRQPMRGALMSHRPSASTSSMDTAGSSGLGFGAAMGEQSWTRAGQTISTSTSGTWQAPRSSSSRSLFGLAGLWDSTPAPSESRHSLATVASAQMSSPTPQTPDDGVQQDGTPLLGYLRDELPSRSSSTGVSDLHNLQINTGAPRGSGARSHSRQPSFDVNPLPLLSQTQAPTIPGDKGHLSRPSLGGRAVTAPMMPPQQDARFWIRSHDYDPREITFNADGAMIGASLAVLVEKMTPHDGVADTTFWTTFFLTFRLFTTPGALLDALLKRYDMPPPPALVSAAGTGAIGERDRALWIDNKVVPVRLRVYNFLKAWLETHWSAEEDGGVLPRLEEWASEIGARSLPSMAARLGVLVRRRRDELSRAELGLPSPVSAGPGRQRNDSMASTASSTGVGVGGTATRPVTPSEGPRSPLSPLRRTSSSDKLRHLSTSSSLASPLSGGPPPTPIISKTLHSLLQKAAPSTASSSASTAVPSISLADFDTLELARQLTIMESRLFARLKVEDLLSQGGTSRKKKKGPVPELKALSGLSNMITGWVADSILNESEGKRRTSLLKFYIKLADKCLMLGNFSTLFAVLAGLNSSTILRLRKTWDALSTKHRLTMDRLGKVIEHTKNHANYRARLRETLAPCLPFLGLILTDITFTCDGNSDTRPSTLDPDITLINWDKYVKLGRIGIDFKRYQEPFNLHELDAVQTYLHKVLHERGSGSIDALWRKSLMLEPRNAGDKPAAGLTMERPNWLKGKV